MRAAVKEKPKTQIVRVSGYTLKREKKPLTSFFFPGIRFRWKLFRGSKVSPDCLVGVFPTKAEVMTFVREAAAEDLRVQGKGKRGLVTRKTGR